jgi:SPX domain protein involved in polyphosphate accumulation
VNIIIIKNISCVRTYVQVPTMRTQYMRVAFQIPFDATVRVSLDTNLCMISERTKETINGECLPHTIP